MVKNFLITAIRNLWKNKVFSCLNISGLAIGITCASLIFLWVEDEVNYDGCYSKKNVLYQIYQNQPSDGKILTINATPGPLATGLKNDLPGIHNTCRTTWPQTIALSLGEKKLNQIGLYADSSIFSMFTLSFLQGKQFNCFKNIHSLIITQNMAERYFGLDQNIIGKTLKVEGSQDFIITGVIQNIPQNSTLQFDWLAPFQIHTESNPWLQSWGSNGIQTFVELDPKTNPAKINKKLSSYIQTKDTKVHSQPFLFSMKDWRLRGEFVNGQQTGGRIQYVHLFSTIAWIILLIACINFMNLATARSEKRSKEVGVRKVLGAVKSSLILQFIGESMLLSFISLLVAIELSYLLLPHFNFLVAKQLRLGLQHSAHVLFLFLIGISCGFFAGSYPAFYLSSFKPILVLKKFINKRDNASFIRKGLVILQFSISVILIISTLVIYQQIQHVKSRPLGYNKENLLQVDLSDPMKTNYRALKQDILSTNQVQNVASSMLSVLFMGSTSSDFTWPGKKDNEPIVITQDWVSPDYFQTTGMKIKEGRNFYDPSQLDSTSIIINQTLAKIIDKNDAIGKLVSRGKKIYQVVGIASDVIYGDMYGKGAPMIFLCYPNNFNYLYLKLKQSRTPDQDLTQINSILKKYDPNYSGTFTFVEEQFNTLFENEMLTSKLSKIFALLAIFISCLGMFGLSAYTAEKRAKEISIRKVLGASVFRLTVLLSMDFLTLVGLSFLLSFPLGYWLMDKWLEDYNYRIVINWLVFLLAGFLSLLIAVSTIGFQSIRAASKNPAINLRID